MSLSQQTRRNLMYRYEYRTTAEICITFLKCYLFRVSIFVLDEQRQVKFKLCSGIQSTTLCKNEEVRLLLFEKI